MRSRSIGGVVIPRALVTLMVSLSCLGAATMAAAQGRFLGREEILLLGAGLRVEPVRQTVPKDIATIVGTLLQAPSAPDHAPPFSPGAVVKGTLRGPSFTGGLAITTRPNTPFNIPPLTVPGVHTLEDIRIEDDGVVLMRATPEAVTIEVIEKLLVTQVSARALTAQEIKQQGLVFDRSSFQAYNFRAAFAIGDNPIPLEFPVLLPVLGVADVGNAPVLLPGVAAPMLPSLKTIIPDTLALQTQIPNLSVVGFSLRVPELKGQNLMVPPIPGIIVIPGDIGFLNQVFNVSLLVGNVAPAASGLVVSALSAELLLPAGHDGVANSPDDPLRMGRTAAGDVPRVQLVVQAGGDGRVGTADDIATLGPGDTGAAEYLVEGRREGTHALEMAMTGTLSGLPIGPVQISGRATGAVLVRNPAFTLTLTHPEIVNAGELYTLDVTATNTSESPANFVTINLFQQNVVGATLAGSSSQQIESIAPGDSATVSFTLDPLVSGPVTAATLESDTNVAGRFSLRTSVGELGVPLSPESLILPAATAALPEPIRKAALGLLGKAWAVATAPSAALPPNVTRFTRQIIYARAIQLAEAGFRSKFGEPIDTAAFQLAFDYAGNDYARIPLERTPAEVPLEQADVRGFDDLRRQSRRGGAWADAIAGVWSPSIESLGASAFHARMAQEVSWRAGHVSALVWSSGVLPYRVSIVDSQGRRVGGEDANGAVVKTIPFSDHFQFRASAGDPARGEMALLASPDHGDYTVGLERIPGTPDGPFTLSLVFPQQDGTLRHVAFENLNAGAQPALSFSPAAPVRLSIVRAAGGAAEPAGPPAMPTRSDNVIELPLAAVGALQLEFGDLIQCKISGAVQEVGRVVGVLFNKEVTPTAVQDQLDASEITRFGVDGNAVIGVGLQPQRRMAFLALRDPVGPLVDRSLTLTGIPDGDGPALGSQTLPIAMTVSPEAGRLTGQVLKADGTPSAFSDVRMYYEWCDEVFGISHKSADADGRFSFDYVLRHLDNVRLVASNPVTGETRQVRVRVQRDGQALHVNLVFLGRGSLTGRVVNQAGTPQPKAKLRVIAQADNSQYGASADHEGRFVVDGVPVGNLVVEAINFERTAATTISDYLPVSGGIVTRDIVVHDSGAGPIETRFGSLSGFVLRSGGAAPVAGVPVIVYYHDDSQPGVRCPSRPGAPPPFECAVATADTDSAGAFAFASVPAGQLRAATFEDGSFQQGEARVQLVEGATLKFNIVMSTGLATVRGVVLDSTGTPVAGARVGGGLSIATTNASGQFVLTDVPLGRHEIVAVSDALVKKGSTTVDLLQLGVEVQATIVLAATSSVGGVIRSASGQPIANIKVYLFKGCGTYKCIEVVGQAVSGPAGQFSMANIPLGVYTLSAFRADFSDGNVKPVVLKFGNEVVDGNLTFRGRGRVTGVLLDDDGVTPLAGVVGLSGDQLAVAGGQVGTGFEYVSHFKIAQTDLATGAFAFEPVWTGPFTLHAAGQFSPDPVSFAGDMPGAGQEVHVELKLQPTSRITGRVLQPDGVTPAGANVIVRYKSRAFTVICRGLGDCETIPQGVQEYSAITDAQGHYVIDPVNAGPFTLTVEDPAGSRVAQLEGELRAGQTGEFDIRLLGRSTIRVRVRGSNGTSPIPNARIKVAQVGFPAHEVDAVADANGELLLAGGNAFAEGEVFAVATDLTNGFAGRASGTVGANDEPVTIDVFLFNAKGTVAGIVHRSDGVTPVANVELVLRNAQGPLGFVLSGPDGRFIVDTVPLGDFVIESFEAATGRQGFATGRVDLDGQEVPVTITQLGIGMVTGRLMEGGTLAPLTAWDIRMSAISPLGIPFKRLHTTTGVDGTFAFPGAPVGTFHLWATKRTQSGGGTTTASVSSEGQVVDVPFVITVVRPKFGRVEGRIFNPNGTPAANAQVTIRPLGVPLSTTADGAGAYHLDNVPVGGFLVEARAPDVPGTMVRRAELLFEGDIQRLDLTLLGAGRITGTVYEADGVTPVPFAPVSMNGEPSSGCGNVIDPHCHASADALGRFAFDGAPVRNFNVSAVHPISGLKGAAGDVLNPGQTADVRIVLQASSVVSGRVIFASGQPAEGVVAELTIVPSPVDKRIFAVSSCSSAIRWAPVAPGASSPTPAPPSCSVPSSWIPPRQQS
jgi:hypothetical protein